MTRTRNRIRYSLAFGLLALTAAAAVVAAPDADRHSYPYDPSCAWGRVADGRGMLVRCLTQVEATALARGNTPAPGAAPTAAAPSAAAASAPEKVDVPDSPAAEEPAKPRQIQVDVGPVTADKGKLGVGKLGTSEAKNRYQQCLEQHGGMTGDTAEVSVRFLVRERGRAEGVSVAKLGGMTKDAARCVAGVVDRRYVGLPSEPIVGATIFIKFAAH